MIIEQGGKAFQAITITLETKEEAQALAGVFGRVGGSRSGRRGITQEILERLEALGVHRISDDLQLDGYLYFKDQ